MSATLEVTGLSSGYGQTTVLRAVGFSADQGEVVCVMGRNGAGKSTLLKAVMGLLPKTGNVQLEGTEIGRWPGHRVNAAGMVWVPQEDSVFPGLTVREHLMISVGREIDRGVELAASLFPVLKERLDQPAQTLSGGERKMLGIAQAFIVEPKVVLMDEPTEGVAPVIVEMLVSAIAGLAKRAAIVLVEQNIDTALALGSRAHILEQGSVVETGEVNDLHSRGILERRLAL